MGIEKKSKVGTYCFDKVTARLVVDTASPVVSASEKDSLLQQCNACCM